MVVLISIVETGISLMVVHWLMLLMHGGDINKRCGDQVIHLRRRNNAMSPSGIYHCEIPTEAVNDDVNTIFGETVYVELYLPSGGNQFTFLGIYIFIVLYCAEV